MIQVLFFGQIKECTNTSSVSMELLPDTTSLVEALHNMYPCLQNHHYSIAINKQLVTQVSLIHHNDEIALLPPFSGG